MRHATLGVALIVALALVSTAATCRQTPRHDTVVSLNLVVAGLGGVQDTERALHAAGKIGDEAHKAFSAKLLVALQLTDDAVIVVQAWRPGQPVPVQLASAIGAIRPALRDALALVASDALMQKVLAVYDAIAGVLALMGGA